MPLSEEDRNWLDKQKKKSEEPAPRPAGKATEDEGSSISDYVRGVGRGLVDTGISAYHTAERIVDPTTPIRHMLGIPSMGELANKYIPQVGQTTEAIRGAAELPPNASAAEIGGKFTGEVAPLFIPGLGVGRAASEAPRIAKTAEEIIPMFRRAASDPVPLFKRATEGKPGGFEKGPVGTSTFESTEKVVGSPSGTGEVPLGPKVRQTDPGGVPPKGAAKPHMSAADYQKMLREDEIAQAAGKKGPRSTQDKLMDIAAHEGPFMLAHHLHMPIWAAYTLARVLGLLRHAGEGELLSLAKKWMPGPIRTGVGAETITPRPRDRDDEEGYRSK